MILLVRRSEGFASGRLFAFLFVMGSTISAQGDEKDGRSYGPVVGTYMGPTQPIISVSGHEAIKEVMLNDDLSGRPELAIMMARTFGEGLGNFFT